MTIAARLPIAAGLCAAAFVAIGPAGHPVVANGLDSDEIELTGNAGHVPDSTKPKLTAYFTQQSYRPGDRARLVVTDVAANVEVRFFRAGGEAEPTIARDVMLGTPVSPPTRLGRVTGRLAVSLRIGDWPSG